MSERIIKHPTTGQEVNLSEVATIVTQGDCSIVFVMKSRMGVHCFTFESKYARDLFYNDNNLAWESTVRAAVFLHEYVASELEKDFIRAMEGEKKNKFVVNGFILNPNYPYSKSIINLSRVSEIRADDDELITFNFHDSRENCRVVFEFGTKDDRNLYFSRLSEELFPNEKTN